VLARWRLRYRRSLLGARRRASSRAMTLTVNSMARIGLRCVALALGLANVGLIHQFNARPSAGLVKSTNGFRHITAMGVVCGRDDKDPRESIHNRGSFGGLRGLTWWCVSQYRKTRKDRATSLPVAYYHQRFVVIKTFIVKTKQGGAICGAID
jgi:hypothetical protein